MKKLEVQGYQIGVSQKNDIDYISLTDIAKLKNAESPAEVVRNWLRNRMTIEFLGIWEKLYNPDFNMVEFDQFRNEAGLNSFILSPQKWIEKTNAIGMVSSSGKYGGTYAHNDIAMEFANWISVEFRLYMVKEFQRLKAEEKKLIGWSAKRELAKINYRIHTDSIKENLIPAELTVKECSFIYADEADILNKALFHQTAKDWKDENPEKAGNIRDYAMVEQLLVLANLESLNAEFIRMGLSAHERIKKLNAAAISQMKSLIENGAAERLSSWTEKSLLVAAEKLKK